MCGSSDPSFVVAPEDPSCTSPGQSAVYVRWHGVLRSIGVLSRTPRAVAPAQRPARTSAATRVAIGSKCSPLRCNWLAADSDTVSAAARLFTRRRSNHTPATTAVRRASIAVRLFDLDRTRSIEHPV